MTKLQDTIFVEIKKINKEIHFFSLLQKNTILRLYILRKV